VVLVVAGAGGCVWLPHVFTFTQHDVDPGAWGAGNGAIEAFLQAHTPSGRWLVGRGAGTHVRSPVDPSDVEVFLVVSDTGISLQ
jgi:hypothetical protein